VKIPKELVMKGENGTFSAEKTFFSTLKVFLTKARTIVNRERDLIKKNRVTCVISDGRVLPIVAGGYNLDLPVLYITNMTTLKKRFLKKRVHTLLVKKPLDFITKSASVLADEIIIPDFPPSNTVCRYLLSDKNRIKKNTIFVGPLVKKELYKSKPIKTKKPTILTMIGGHKYGKLLIDVISQVAEKKRDINFIAVSRHIKKKSTIENLKLLPFVSNIYPYMRASDIIIAQAGHSTTMEMICSGKTGILIPVKNQYEQESIVKRAKELELFETLSYSRLTPKILIKKINILLKQKKCKKNVKKLSKLAIKLNGPKKVADIAIDYSSRITKY
jgi:uncharacterized protein (TIGR00661 family)